MAAAHVSGVAALVIASRVGRQLTGGSECQLEATARHSDSAQLGQPLGAADAAAAGQGRRLYRSAAAASARAASR